MKIESWKTAIHRNKLSKPVQIYKSKLRGKILNYGSGHGEDTELLNLEGFEVYNYDKYFNSNANMDIQYDTIMCNYVLNVIPDINERIEVLEHINKLLKHDGYAYISVRHISELKSIKTNVKYNDGIVTRKNTFQKFYEQQEIIDFVWLYFRDVEVIWSNPLIVRANK